MLSSLRDDPLGSVSMYFAARFDARTAPSASRAAPRKLVRRRNWRRWRPPRELRRRRRRRLDEEGIALLLLLDELHKGRHGLALVANVLLLESAVKSFASSP